MSDRLGGILLGTVVGDALELPAEGFSPGRRRRLIPGPWRHRLLFGRGMVSDDTDYPLPATFTLQTGVASPAESCANVGL
jgi:hypothetical protein